MVHRSPTAPRGLDLNAQADHQYGAHHRSGWRYAVEQLQPLHREGAVFLESFVERRFGWAGHEPDAIIERPWIGFVHVPAQIPPWFLPEVANETIFASEAWQRSAPHCRGLYTLSHAHRRQLAARLWPLPVEALLHPTGPPALHFTWARFRANPEPRLVQVGWWLRVLHAIAELPPVPYRRAILPGARWARVEPLMEQERAARAEAGTPLGSLAPVERMGWVDHAAYDRLLSENLVFLDLYAASATNTIIECMVRHTPVLVNPLEAVVEYLGPDYPLYYATRSEAAARAADLHRVRAAHEYLRDSPKLASLRGEAFRRSLVDSEIYRACQAR